MKTSIKRMQLLWLLALSIIILTPTWILAKQTIFTENSNLQKPLLNHEFKQQVLNRSKITTFRRAKKAMYKIYANHRITFYCGCNFSENRSIDLTACLMPILGKRIKTEAEHIVPASHFGKKLACWQQGGRKNCRIKNIAFQKAEADLVNLVPAIGYINLHRLDYHFGEIAGEERKFGTCDFEINSMRRIAEPQTQLLGFIARVTLYMDSIYGIDLTNAEIENLKKQSAEYPPTEWEIYRDNQIAEIQGNHNPFIIK